MVIIVVIVVMVLWVILNYQANKQGPSEFTHQPSLLQITAHLLRLHISVLFVLNSSKSTHLHESI